MELGSGDEDLGNGYTQDLYCQYKADCSFIKALTANSKSQYTLGEVQKLQHMFKSSMEFLTTGEAGARVAYEKVLQASRPSDKIMV